MEWLDDLAAALPAPRPDEPADLRRRIVAELRDHLHAAFQRELLLTANAELAQRNVVARFGDPARLARKLWYEAMWEKIMSQRLMLVAMAVVVLVSAGSMGLTWFVVVQAGQVNQVLLEQNRAANEAMLAKLTALNNTGSSPVKSMEWTSLKVRLSTEKPGGAPVGEIPLTLQGQILAVGSTTSMVRTTNADGIAEFGFVRPGQYILDFEMPWGDSMESSQSNSILTIGFSGQLLTVLPGDPQTVEIICPTKPEEAEIRVTVDWPSDLAGRGLWLVCDFVGSPRELGGQKWSQKGVNAARYVVVDPSGQMANPDMRPFGDDSTRDNPSFFREDGQTGFYIEEELRHYVGASKSFVDSPGIYRYLKPDSRGITSGYNYGGDENARARLWLPKTTAGTRLKWPAGTYKIAHFAVGGKSDKDETSDDKALPDDVLHPVFLGGISIDMESGKALNPLYPNEASAHAVPRKRGTGKPVTTRFTAEPGRVNEWQLSLPEPLINILQLPLAEIEAAANENRSRFQPQVSPAGVAPAAGIKPVAEDSPDDDDSSMPRRARQPTFEDDVEPIKEQP